MHNGNKQKSLTGLLRIATDPYLYDRLTVNWEKEGERLESPNRAHYWSFLEPDASTWKNKSLMDIGAGTGWLLDVTLRKVGVAPSSLGIEPSFKNIAIAKRLYPHITMIQTTLQLYQPDRRFDIAVSVLSILHIYPLGAAFTKIAQLLSPKGIFIAIVPDYNFFRSKRKGRIPKIEELNNDECVTMIPREYGIVADIVRKLEKYEVVAGQYNFSLMDHKPMPPAPQDCLKHPELAKTIATHLLKFRKE